MQRRVIMAGFGGQGVMAIGQLLAYASMLDGWQVTWMPSYGPEMRGGSANCSVILSKEPIGAPTISVATDLIAMNEPSYEKFKDRVEKGGHIFYNASLFHVEEAPAGVHLYGVACNEIARKIGMDKIANMVMLGAFLSVTQPVPIESVLKAFTKVFGDKKEKFIPINREALEAGWKSLEANEEGGVAHKQEDFHRTPLSFSGEETNEHKELTQLFQAPAFNDEKERVQWILEQEKEGVKEYQKLAEQFQKTPAAAIFESLADQEVEHVQYLEKLLSHLQEKGEWHIEKDSQPLLNKEQEEAIVHASEESFSHQILYSYLQAAMSLEQNAQKFYQEAAEHTEEPKVKALFEQLAYWENYHYEQLKGQAEIYKEAWWSDQSFSPM